MIRIKFNLNSFIEELNWALIDRPDLIDDKVQEYKDFLSRVDEPLLTEVRDYVSSHRLVKNNKRIQSFINVCYV
jgi:hypothetical protein